MRRLGWIVVCVCLILSAGLLARGQEPDVAKLSAALAGDAADKAADDLARLGPRAKPAVPALIKALDSKDLNVRWRAARALGAIGTDAGSAASALVTHLADPDAAVRTQCAAALGKLGSKSDAVVTALGKRVADDEPHVRRAAIAALQRLQPGPKVLIPILTQVIDDSQPDVAMAAMGSLAEIGEAAVPSLSEALADPKARHWAAVVLAEIGPAAAGAVPALMKLAADPEPEVRMQVIIALGQIGPAADAATPTLVAALKDEQPAVRYAAAFALGKLRAKEASDDLSKLTTSDDPTLKLVATWAVARIQPDDPVAMRQAMEAIAEGIRSDDAQLSRISARALAEIDGSSESLTPAIKAALDELDPTVLDHLMDALSVVGPKAVNVLTAAMKDPKTRGPAIRALGHIGPDAKPAAADLTAALADKDPIIVSDAALALGAIGPDAAKAVPALTQLAGKPDPGARYASILALGRIGAAAKSAVPTLEKQVGAKEPMVAVAAVWAVRRIDPASRTLVKTALPVLTKMLATTDDVLHVQAAAALGDLGPDARDALPALKKLLDDPKEEARRAASEAIAKIQAAPKAK